MFMNSKQIGTVPSHTTTFCYSGMTSDGTITISFKCVGQANRCFIVTLIISDVRETTLCGLNFTQILHKHSNPISQNTQLTSI